jgi:DME family drug/metabolite transporter
MMGELAALGAAISWTVSALLYREALLDAKPISANILRLTLTSLVLLLFLAIVGKLGILIGLPSDILVLAALSGVIGLGFGDTLYMVSLKLTGVARAVPVTCTYPLFTLLWAVLLQGEPVTFSVVLGAVVIVIGIWLLSHEKESETASVRRKVLIKGLAFALATAIIWSVSITMMDIAVKQTPDLDRALMINTFRVVAVAVSLLAVSPVIDRSLGFLRLDRKTVVALIAGGIVALGLGWFFMAYSFVETSQARAVPLSSTTPLFSTLTAIVLLHEKVTAKNVLGSIMIVTGIFLIFLA